MWTGKNRKLPRAASIEQLQLYCRLFLYRPNLLRGLIKHPSSRRHGRRNSSCNGRSTKSFLDPSPVTFLCSKPNKFRKRASIKYSSYIALVKATEAGGRQKIT